MSEEQKTYEALLEENKKLKSNLSGETRKNSELLNLNKRANDDLAKFKSIGETDSDIMRRLERIQEAYKAKEAQLETRYYARERALVAGIDYQLIADYPFDSKESVDAKVSALTQFMLDAKDKGVSERLMVGSKPRAGADLSYTPRTNNMDDAIAREMKNAF